jgi:hypothetical protein
MPLNIFDGSSWNPFKSAKVYDGSQWQDAKTIKIYNGAEWKTVSSLIPVNSALPTISWPTNQITQSPDYGVGKNITVTDGVWSNNPNSFKYKWYYAEYTPNTPNWILITGQTTNTYYLPADKVGCFIKVEVIAVNQYGDSLSATYSMPFNAYLIPESAKNAIGTATSNTQATITWDESVGANGYYIQWWQAGSYHEERLPADRRSYTIPTANLDPQYGVGVFFAPTNDSNPVSRYISGFYLQGNAVNPNVNDIRPYKPSVNFTIQSGQINGGTASWSINNFTQTSWEIYNAQGIFASNPSITYTGTTQNNQFLTYVDPTTDSGPWYIIVHGYADGYPSISLQSNNASFRTAAPIPSGSVTLSGTGMAGDWLTASVSMDSSATSYYVVIIKATGHSPSSISDVNALESSTNGQASHQVTTGEAAGTPDQFRAFVIFYGPGGQSQYIGSNTIVSYPYVPPAPTDSLGATTDTGSASVVFSSSDCNGTITRYYRYMSQPQHTLILRDYHDGNGPVSTYTYQSADPRYYYDYYNSAYVNGNCGYVDCSVCTYGYGSSYTTSVSFSTCQSGTANYHDCITSVGCNNIPVFQSCTTCNTCTGYSSNYTSFNGVCASGQGYYRTCYTPGTCSNIEQFVSCVPQALSGKGVCLSYDVTNSASAFYYDCYSVGQCNTHTTNNRTPC